MTEPVPPAVSGPSAEADRPAAAGRHRAALTAPADSSDAAAVQAGIAGDRARLLAGRGPGASQDEIDKHTRARTQLAGEPMPQHLQALAQQTALARPDTAALPADIAAARDKLARTVGAIREKVNPRQVGTRAVQAAEASFHAGEGPWSAMAGARGRITVALGVVIVAVVVVLRRRR